MLKRLTHFWRRRRVTTADELRDFLAAEAVYLSQKSTIGYCQARAGMLWQKLDSEPAFMAALDACRWQAMAEVLADIVVVTEGFLRPRAGDAASRLPEALTTMFTEILESAPAPAAARADWQALPDELSARLARAQMADVHRPGEIAKTCGARIFELLPIHPSVRAHDREVVINNVRFGMVTFAERLARNVRDRAGLARQLTASVPVAP